MTERPIFECDVSGERYGAKNAGDGVIEFDIVRKRGNPWDTWSETCHISNNVLLENEIHSRYNVGRFTRLFVESTEEGEEIVAVEYKARKMDGSGFYKEFVERDDVTMADWDENFFEFVEEELLY